MAMIALISVVLGLVSLSSANVITAELTFPTNTSIVPLAATGKFKATLVPGQCDVSLQAYGYLDTDERKRSYIEVNGLTYLDTYNDGNAYRGFNLAKLDMKTCIVSNLTHHDTHQTPEESEKLAKYIYDLPDGTHILGVTSDDVTQYLQLSAKNALISVGVDITGIGFRDKALFHAVKGKPDKAVVKSSKAGGSSLYYKEKAATCNICQNGGILKMNTEGTGLYCKCPRKAVGFYCEDILDICV